MLNNYNFDDTDLGIGAVLVLGIVVSVILLFTASPATAIAAFGGSCVAAIAGLAGKKNGNEVVKQGEKMIEEMTNTITTTSAELKKEMEAVKVGTENKIAELDAKIKEDC